MVAIGAVSWGVVNRFRPRSTRVSIMPDTLVSMPVMPLQGNLT
jgi:hypothetical protein